jgi:hypothetical protein
VRGINAHREDVERIAVDARHTRAVKREQHRVIAFPALGAHLPRQRVDATCDTVKRLLPNTFKRAPRGHALFSRAV